MAVSRCHNGRCRNHGGKSVAGVASGTFQHGRYSRALPERLAERYQHAQQDPDRLQIHDEIALVDARLADVLARVDSGESGACWRTVQQALKRYLKARGGPTEERHLAALEGAVLGGVADYAAWGEVYQLIDQRVGLVQAERRRLLDLQQYLTAEQALAYMRSLTEIVRRHVTDRPTLAAISADLTRLAEDTA